VVAVSFFDSAASEAYATLRARARAEGKAISSADGYIAATAYSGDRDR
jgi:predicted nucleic acid-binding protein